MKARELARMLHESYLQAHCSRLPEDGIGRGWDDIDDKGREGYVAIARILLKRLTITPKPAPRST